MLNSFPIIIFFFPQASYVNQSALSALRSMLSNNRKIQVRNQDTVKHWLWRETQASAQLQIHTATP